MKTIFVVNPCAGKGNGIDALLKNIKTVDNAEVYITKAIGDARKYVKTYCETHGAARFIACGGDGTFSEVVNGVVDFEGAEVGVIPIGTGNDFYRNFEERNTDISAYTKVGTGVRCDAIRYAAYTDEGVVTRYCANMCNIGFDCNVADLTSRMKKKPFISGSMAYFLSIFGMLVQKKGANVRIEVDGQEKHNGKLLLTSVANGCYCGGGIKSNPMASVCDGKININIINNVSRLRFLSLLPSYMRGTHMNCKNIEKILCCEKCTEITITPLDGNLKLCIDGEIMEAGKTQFAVCPGAFTCFLPGDRKACKEKLFV